MTAEDDYPFGNQCSAQWENMCSEIDQLRATYEDCEVRNMKAVADMSKVVRAWNDPGPWPMHHARMIAKLRKEWPALYTALLEACDQT